MLPVYSSFEQSQVAALRYQHDGNVKNRQHRLPCGMLDSMPCSLDVLKEIPLFSLLDEDEMSVLASQVEVREFAVRQKIYRLGEPGERAYVLVNGHVHVTTVDEDQQEVLVADPEMGEFFGFASMMTGSLHTTSATALEATTCVEIDKNDILALLERKPHAGMDMMAVLARQFHASQQLVRGRAGRNPNEVIDDEATFGERIAPKVITNSHALLWDICDSIVITNERWHGLCLHMLLIAADLRRSLLATSSQRWPDRRAATGPQAWPIPARPAAGRRRPGSSCRP